MAKEKQELETVTTQPESESNAADKSQISPATFRFAEKDAAAFRRMCAEHGMTNAQGLAHLLQVAEVNKAKEIIPERQTEIETFEMNVKAILKSYLDSLELCKSAEARVTEMFATDIKSQKKTIVDLQKQVEDAKTEAVEAKMRIETAETERDVAKQESATASKQAQTAAALAEKAEQTNKMLTEKLAEAESKVKGWSDLLAERDEFQAQVAALKNEANVVEQAHKTALAEAVATAKDEMREKMDALRDKMDTKLAEARDEAQAARMEAQTAQAAADKAAVKIESLQTDIAKTADYDQIAAERQGYKDQVKDLAHKAELTARDLTAAEKQNKELQKQIEELKTQMAELREKAATQYAKKG